MKKPKPRNDKAFPRMDNVGIVVDDLKEAIAFFRELGLELEGRMKVEGDWVDKTVGLKNTQSEIAMMKTPDGHGRIELATYHRPKAGKSVPEIPPSNTLGLHRVMFEVADIDEMLSRLKVHGAELVGEVAQYENAYRLCYLRGPGGIIVALAEKVG
jgi:catechol 2,3-dioxygenase-like lactoylglutathione lyase family enzyme